MMDKSFGDRIRELRAREDLSLRELGERVKKTAPFLSDIEFGRRFPSPELLEELAKALKTTVDDLKSFDTRAPVEEIKKMAIENPEYGIALRRLIESNVSPEDLLKLAKRNPKK